MITESKAHAFLKDRLGITDARQRLINDKANLLDDIILRYQNVIPFQNLSQISLPDKKKHIPTLEENVQAVLRGEGGMCWTLNSVFFLLLKALGYDVYPTSSAVVIVDPDNGNDHILIIVQNLRKPGDHYMVDVGLGLPTFKAIPLDFEEESPVYTDAHETYKLIKRDGKIIRFQKKGPFSPPYAVEEGEWGLMNHFRLVPMELGIIGASIDKLIYSQLDTYFYRNLHISVFPNNKLASFRNKTYLFQSDKGDISVIELEDDQMVTNLRQILPLVPKKVIESAIKNWLKFKNQ